MGIGSVSISFKTEELIKKIIPKNSVILELGSGEGTVRLSKNYTMFSVENQPEWMNRFPDSTTYINCRTKEYDATFTKPDIEGPQTGWYDPDMLFPNLPDNYDLILIDGPGGHFGRGGFYKFIHKFNTNVPIVFDDIHRLGELDLMKKVSKKINKPYITSNEDKALGYIL